ncbi:MAG: hydroxymethylbilane synthase [Pelagibacteraceae bacterium]|nr:MAG: hydroxymethylbilane synthase [Pelagibacteraceae bacterium]
MKKRKIVIGSRGSKLALIYAQNAKNTIIQKTDLNEDDIIIKEITTKGDQVQDVRLSELGGKGLFTSNIENQLQDKNIDIAVHALKDMPAKETEGLTTNAFLKRNDPREILITTDKKKLQELKNNAIIGTSSYRREFQIKKIRTDLNCKLLRGNVDTRIKKLNDGLYDAIILSYAGVKSLKMDDKIAQIFSTNEIIPSAGQGIIALQCRNNDNEIISILDKINDYETFQRAQAERNVLKVLEGDCETAVGVHAVIEEGKIILEAELFSLDGKERFYEKKSSKVTEAQQLGIEIGEKLRKKSKNTYKK